MELRGYLRVLRGHRLFVVASVLVCTAVAGALAWTRTPTYAAHTQLFVSTSGVAGDASAAYQGGLFSEERVLSYVQIVSSPAVLNAVIKQLGLPESSQQLQAEIQVSVPTNTVLLNLTVQDRSPQRAEAIADAFAGQLIRFVHRLETPPGGGSSPVKLSVTSPAQLPTRASSPRKPEYLALGIVLGLALGIGGAVLREALDRRIRTEEDASTIAGAAVLGSVAEYAGRKVRPPVVSTHPSSARTEAYRRLRANLRTLVDDHSLKSFVISSPVVGEGKTVVAANLGVVLAQAGYRVALVDANFRRPKLSAMLGLSSSVGLMDVLLDDLPLSSALQTWRPGVSLEVIGSGSEPPNRSELLGSLRFSTMLEELAVRFDVIFIDAPALLEATDAALMARVTSGAIVVARFNSTRSDDLATAVESLHALNARTLGVVLNRRVRRGWINARPRSSGYGRASFAVPVRSSTDS